MNYKANSNDSIHISFHTYKTMNTANLNETYTSHIEYIIKVSL